MSQPSGHSTSCKKKRYCRLTTPRTHLLVLLYIHSAALQFEMRVGKWGSGYRNRESVSFCSWQLHVSDLWEVITTVAALPPVQQGLQFGQVPPERSRRLRLLLLLPLLEVLELLPLFAVLLHSQALRRTEGCQ